MSRLFTSPAERERRALVTQARAVLDAEEQLRAAERRAAEKLAERQAARRRHRRAVARWLLIKHPIPTAIAVAVPVLHLTGQLVRAAVIVGLLGLLVGTGALVVRHLLRASEREAEERRRAEEERRLTDWWCPPGDDTDGSIVTLDAWRRQTAAAVVAEPDPEPVPAPPPPPDPRTVALRRLQEIVGRRRAVQLVQLGEALGMTERAAGQHVRALGVPVVKVTVRGGQRRGVRGSDVAAALETGTEGR